VNAIVRALLTEQLLENNTWAEWCTVIVFGGLLVEYTILLWLKRNEFSKREIVLTIIAGVAIAGGVYGEYFFGSKASTAAMALQADAEERVAKLNLRSAEASNKATALEVELRKQELQTALVEKEAGENKKEAERLRLRAENEAMARVQLEKLVSWRTIPEPAQKEIGERLKKFQGVRIAFTVNTGDAEGLAFGTQMAAIAIYADWSIVGFAPVADLGHFSELASALLLRVTIIPATLPMR
jgi:hypothetical protein